MLLTQLERDRSNTATLAAGPVPVSRPPIGPHTTVQPMTRAVLGWVACLLPPALHCSLILVVVELSS